MAFADLRGVPADSSSRKFRVRRCQIIEPWQHDIAAAHRAAANAVSSLRARGARRSLRLPRVPKRALPREHLVRTRYHCRWIPTIYFINKMLMGGGQVIEPRQHLFVRAERTARSPPRARVDSCFPLMTEIATPKKRGA